jgi:hypothetical protein
MMINKEFLKKLIVELRSGKHKQHHGSYRGPDGSLCIMALAYDVSETTKDDLGRFNWTKFWSNIGAERNEHFIINGAQWHQINDSGTTFAEFADIFENKLKELEAAQ